MSRKIIFIWNVEICERFSQLVKLSYLAVGNILIDKKKDFKKYRNSILTSDTCKFEHCCTSIGREQWILVRIESGKFSRGLTQCVYRQRGLWSEVGRKGTCRGWIRPFGCEFIGNYCNKKKGKKIFTCVLSVIGRPPPRYENPHVGPAFFDKSPRSGAFTRIVKHNNNSV